MMRPDAPEVPAWMLIGVALFLAGVLVGVLAVRWTDTLRRSGGGDNMPVVVYEVPDRVKVTGHGWGEEGF